MTKTRRHARRRARVGAQPPVSLFALSVFEVTIEDYDRFVYPNRLADEGWDGGRRPVINVSWDDAQRIATRTPGGYAARRVRGPCRPVRRSGRGTFRLSRIRFRRRLF